MTFAIVVGAERQQFTFGSNIMCGSQISLLPCVWIKYGLITYQS